MCLHYGPATVSPLQFWQWHLHYSVRKGDGDGNALITMVGNGTGVTVLVTNVAVKQRILEYVNYGCTH